ncbi:hypothetical protein [Catellatospora sichuanensis]|uniref:hypothetical protein n=1 Tax=Catellatospora sichuanensis TaxID=1969805 RepID=UPI0011836E01|nr:hypothetical protein [Catellatospora sichuanensis]
MTTRAPAVKSFLRDLLTDMPMTSADKLQVSYGYPVRSVERKWTFVGEITWDEIRWVTNRSREETFSITVGFSAQITGGTPEEVENYVTAMASDFEAELAANPGMSGLAITSIFTPKRMNSWPVDPALYEAQFETVVTATCRP